jgi:hypothetical protein
MVSDVEMEPSGVKRHSSSPLTASESSVKRTKLGLSEEQLKEIDNKLNLNSLFWDAVAVSSKLESDPSQFNSSLPMLLMQIASLLPTTVSKASVLTSLSFDRATSLVQGLNSQELAELEAGLKKGLKEKDWKDLVTHRASRFSERQVALNDGNSNTSSCPDRNGETISGGAYCKQ